LLAAAKAASTRSARRWASVGVKAALIVPIWSDGSFGAETVATRLPACAQTGRVAKVGIHGVDGR
jgi:hypothetical protein